MSELEASLLTARAEASLLKAVVALNQVNESRWDQYTVWSQAQDAVAHSIEVMSQVLSGLGGGTQGYKAPQQAVTALAEVVNALRHTHISLHFHPTTWREASERRPLANRAIIRALSSWAQLHVVLREGQVKREAS